MDHSRVAIRDQQTVKGSGCARAAGGEYPPGVFVPDHQLLRCIGRGSYGEVWLACNRRGDYRAVKLVHREAFDHERPFERELAGLQRYDRISRSHEGLIGVLDIGINERQGYFYCVMELGDDQTAGQDIDPRRYSPKTLAKEIALRGILPFRSCLQLGLTLSLALAQLHKHGLVHRDVKPSNIIFVKGVPKLADIGLVAEADATRSYVGTEGFIPPEGPGTAQADVYSLGKVLYEASTGKDRHEFPELPTCLDRFPDHELFLELNEAIVRACRNDARERYPSAWELYTDLQLLAHGESIKLLNSREKYRASLKWIGALSSLFLIAAALLGNQFLHERHSATDSQRQQISAGTVGNSRVVESENLAGAAWQQGPERAFLCEKGNRLAAFTGGPVQTCNSTKGLAPGRSSGQPAAATLAFLSPDGTRVLTACGKRVLVRDVLSGEAVFAPLEHPAPVVHAEFSQDGSRLVTCCASDEPTNSFAQVWNAASGQPVGPPLRHNNSVLFASFCPAGKRVVTASADFTAVVWEAATGRQLSPPLQHECQVRTARFSPDGQWIVTASQDKTARVWKAETGEALTLPLRHKLALAGARFLPEGGRILTSSAQGHCWLWELQVAPRLPNDLQRADQPLSDREATSSSQPTPVPQEPLPLQWRRLWGVQPNGVTGSTMEIERWRQLQAEECEAEQ